MFCFLSYLYISMCKSGCQYLGYKISFFNKNPFRQLDKITIMDSKKAAAFKLSPFCYFYSAFKNMNTLCFEGAAHQGFPFPPSELSARQHRCNVQIFIKNDHVGVGAGGNTALAP